MTPNMMLKNDSRLRLLVEGARVSLFIIVLLVTLLGHFFQPAFINFALLAPFYGFILGAMALHFGIALRLDRCYSLPRLLFLTFLADAFLISGLIYFSGMNQSLFLFLHLINILLAGVAFRTEGGLITALVTALFFTVAALLGPEIKALQFVLLLVLNNVAFFLVAGLAGYLSDQLESVGHELRQTGLSLKAARQLNQLVIENVPSGLLTTDKTGVIIQSNEAARRLLARGDCVGKTLEDVLPGLPAPGGPETERFDLKFEGPDGSPRILGVTSSSFVSPEVGGLVHVILFDDLTQIRYLEGSVRQAEKMAAVGQLAAGIAHEIRNPLSGISGSVELLSQSATDENDKKLMNIILREIERLNALITEFLDYARPEVPPTDPVDLKSLLSEMLGSLALSKVFRPEIQVEKTFPLSPVQVAAHRDKLKQALLNILINACQALEKSDSPTLQVALQANATEVSLSIRDNGCGMSPELRKRIFEPFHTTKPKGTGLGLAITHKILEGHGARIFVESEEGRGTEFKLVFPAMELRNLSLH